MAFDAQTNSLRYKTTKRTSEPDRLLTPEPGPSITRLLTAMHDSDNQDKLRLNCVENSVRNTFVRQRCTSFSSIRQRAGASAILKWRLQPPQRNAPPVGFQAERINSQPLDTLQALLEGTCIAWTESSGDSKTYRGGGVRAISGARYGPGEEPLRHQLSRHCLNETRRAGVRLRRPKACQWAPILQGQGSQPSGPRVLLAIGWTKSSLARLVVPKSST